MDTEGIRERLNGIIGQIMADLERLPEWGGNSAMRAALEEMLRIAETIQPQE